MKPHCHQTQHPEQCKPTAVHIRHAADRVDILRAGRRLDPERALAFAMGLHGRLGRASPVGRLDDALARHVLHDLAAASAPRQVAL